MSNLTIFSVVFFLLSVGLLVMLYRSAQGISEKIALVEQYAIKAKNWPITIGIVEELGMNLDYPWPDGEQTRPNVSQEWIDSQRSQEIENAIFMDALIRYSFSVNGLPYTSRNIQIIPTDDPLPLVMKLRIGDAIKVRYNPDNPEECFIKKNKQEDLSSYNWVLLQALGPKILALLGSLLILSALIYLSLT